MMGAPTEIPASLLREISELLAQLSGFALGVAKAMPAMSDLAEPLAKRADKAADELRNHTARAILAEHDRQVLQ
jgi:hypothetical protein